MWTTQFNELVGIGDDVALSLLEHSDAVGRIVAGTDDGQIRCVLLQCHSCKPGKIVTVTADQLLVRVYYGDGHPIGDLDHQRAGSRQRWWG